MKTTEQIADEAMRAFTLIESDRFEDGTSDVEECSAPYIRDQIIAAIEADRAQREIPTVVIRDGLAFHGEDVDVIDLDFMGQTGAGSRSEMDQGDIDTVVERLRAAGFDSAADDVIEWWTA